MRHRLIMLGSASLLLVSPQQAASSDAAGYCVRPITIEKVDAPMPYSQSKGPSTLKFAFDTSTPFPVDNVKDPPDTEPYYLREVFWHIQPDYRLSGPINIGQRRVLGTDGRLVYLLESNREIDTDEDASSQPREDRIWSLAADGEMEPVEGPWTDARWHLSLESNKNSLDKLVLIGWAKEPGSSNRQNYFALKDGRVEHWGEDRPFIPQKTFPEFAVSVDYGYGLSLKHSKDQAIQTLSLPHTEEHGWWESVNIDRYGWLFAEGYGNDYAVKLDLEDGLEVDRIHRFTGRGWLARFFEWIFGIGPETEVDSTQWSSQCVDYSPVLRLTLFCDPAKVLREGNLHDFPDHTSELDRYLGDASGAGVALIEGQKNELYAFDGKALQLVSNNLGNFVKTQDVPEAKRTFVNSETGSYELMGTFPNLILVELASRNRGDKEGRKTVDSNLAFRGMTFWSFPNSTSVLGFDKRSVWHFGKKSNEMIWKAQNARILASEVAPVANWGGLMFLTADAQANLIEQCSI